MASTYSTNLKIELIGTGEQAGIWGGTTNTNLGTALEQAIVGKADINMNSTTITLSLTNTNAAQDARAFYLNLTGTPGGAATLEVPAVQKPYIVKNGSNQVVTVKVTGQTGVAVPVGATMWLYNNGTDVTNAITNLPSGATVGGVVIGTTSGTVTSVSGTGTVNGISLSGTVTSSGNITLGGTLTGVDLASQVTGTLPVANGGTGVTSSTGTGSVVLSNTPTLVTPVLGTPTSGNLSNCTADGTNAVGFKNIPAIADKTAAYTLAVGDVGKVVGVGSGGSIEIPNSTFAAGDAVLVFNNTTGPITITCTITTAYIAGADADVASVTLATRGVCNILFISGTACVLTGNIA
jgi:hypothetical protein